MSARALRTALLATGLLLLGGGCMSHARLPHMPRLPGDQRHQDACAVASLAIGDLIKDRHEPTAARTRSPVLLGTPTAYRLAGGVEQPLDLRDCPAVATLALGGGMTLLGPGSPPTGPLYYLSNPTFSADGTHAMVTWTLADARAFGIRYKAVKTPLGWALDGDADGWLVTD